VGRKYKLSQWEANLAPEAEKITRTCTRAKYDVLIDTYALRGVRGLVSA